MRQEPLDIERNISLTTVMDIEVYDEFVSTTMLGKPEVERLPERSKPSTAAAIQPPPPK